MPGPLEGVKVLSFCRNLAGPYCTMILCDLGAEVIKIEEPGRPPVRVGFSTGDIGAGLFTATAILAALHEREKSGKGQWVDVAMVDCQVAFCENACARYFATGEIPKPLGARHPLFTPFQVFPTQDGYMVLIIVSDEDWQRFCKLTGRGDLLSDPRFQGHPARIENYSVYEPLMNELMKNRTTAKWLALLEPAGIICAPVNNIAQAVAGPHILEREMVVEVEHPRAGRLKVAGTPMNFSRTPCKIEKACPDLGQDTEEILKYLGMQ